MGFIYQVLRDKNDTFAGFGKQADFTQKTEYGRDFSAQRNER